jgi:hypothetical protein
MTSGEYLQIGDCQGLLVVHAQRKVRSNWLGPSEEKLKKGTPFYLRTFFVEKYFPVSVGTHLVYNRYLCVHSIKEIPC